MRRRGERGFTLVETVVVATIFAILSAGIAGSFFSGMKLWKRAKDIDFSEYDAILTFEKISRELRQSVEHPSIVFEGEASQISFPTLIGNTIFKITYSFDRQQDALIRGQITQEDIILEEEEEGYTERKVLALDSLVLSYLFFDPQIKKYDWKDEWGKEEGVFSAIKFNTQINGEEFNKTIFIPIS